MYMDYFAVPNLTLPVRRGQRPPILRFAAFLVVVLGCLAVDALVLFALYKAGAALIAQFGPVLLAQGALGSAAVLYLAYTYYSSRHPHGRINHDAHLGGAITGLLFVALTEPRAYGYLLQSIL